MERHTHSQSSPRKIVKRQISSARTWRASSPKISCSDFSDCETTSGDATLVASPVIHPLRLACIAMHIAYTEQLVYELFKQKPVCVMSA